MFKQLLSKPSPNRISTVDFLEDFAGKCWVLAYSENVGHKNGLALAIVAQATLRAHHEITDRFGLVSISTINPSKYWDICASVCTYWISVAANSDREDTKDMAYACLSAMYPVFSQAGIFRDQANESAMSGFSFKIMRDVDKEPYEPSKTLEMYIDKKIDMSFPAHHVPSKDIALFVHEQLESVVERMIEGFDHFRHP